MRNITKQEYVSCAESIHGKSTFDYTDTVFIDMKTPITIKSEKFGIFTIKPLIHLSSADGKKVTKNNTERFIKIAELIHGKGRYDYSEVEYVNNSTKIKIKCNNCGNTFYQKPSMHLCGNSCPYCCHKEDDNKIKKQADIFFKKAIDKFGDRFDYSKAVYVNTKTPLLIKCNKHNIWFSVLPHTHLDSINGSCPECIKEHMNIVLKNKPKHKIKSTEEFINKMIEIHGPNKFDYSKTVYTGINNKVTLICRDCGYEFSSRCNELLKGRGCPKCSRMKKRLSREEVIRRIEEIHGVGTFDFSQMNYKNMDTKVYIICNKHHKGWWVTPSHLLHGSTCPLCARERVQEKMRHNTEDFIRRAEEVHGKGTYDYSKVEYIDTFTPVEIICPIHGSFWQKPTLHLLKVGCPMCAIDKRTLSKDEFIKRAEEIHGKGTYDYSKVNYINNYTPVEIICHKHGSFWQKPLIHLRGCGCQQCAVKKTESIIVKTVREYLESLNIRYVLEKTFDWLRNEAPLRLDFYLPDYNAVIECHGSQHFKSVDYYGGENYFKQQVKNDHIKYNLCKEHNILILYFTNQYYINKDYKYDLGKLYFDVSELIDTIKNSLNKNI